MQGMYEITPTTHTFAERIKSGKKPSRSLIIFTVKHRFFQSFCFVVACLQSSPPTLLLSFILCAKLKVLVYIYTLLQLYIQCKCAVAHGVHNTNKLFQITYFFICLIIFFFVLSYFLVLDQQQHQRNFAESFGE